MCSFVVLPVDQPVLVLSASHGSWVGVLGMSGEVSPGHRRSAEQGTAYGSLPSAGQLYTCSAAQPQPQNEPGGMFDYYSTCIVCCVYTHILLILCS